MSWWIGLDLGQAADYAALACMEKSMAGSTAHYALRHMERFAIGTAYPSVVAQVGTLLAQPPLAGSTLVPDATGVGRAVTDLLKEASLAARIIPVTITAGRRARRDENGYLRVPKKELVGVMQAVLGHHRLHVPSRLPLAETFVRELELFTVQLTDAGNERFGAKGERAHDDLVLAVSLALWAAENVA